MVLIVELLLASGGKPETGLTCLPLFSNLKLREEKVVQASKTVGTSGADYTFLDVWGLPEFLLLL